MTETENPYQGREQTQIKHFFLSKYLERFSHIVGSAWGSITYVDGFSGPWNVPPEQSSFSLALAELRKARETYKAKGKALGIRCYFVERDPESFTKLDAFARTVTDINDLRTCCGAFENSVGDIMAFLRKDRKTFAFIFIDPTGWTGFAMDTIEPLLRHSPGEVLINFQTKFINRFIEDEACQESLERLFGNKDFKNKLNAYPEEDREDLILLEYCFNLKKRGGFEYFCYTPVMHPSIERTNFHLIYATRHPRGIEVFKGVEKKAAEFTKEIRAEAKYRKAIDQTQQQTLFEPDVVHQSTRYDELRYKYRAQARMWVESLLAYKGNVPYEMAWTYAMAHPLVSDADLKSWISEWQKAKPSLIRVEGLKGKERVPKLDENHRLIWLGERSVTEDIK